MSWLGEAYTRAYATVCGRHPHVYPWHFQWLSGRALARDLREVLGNCGGRVLDVGCGVKPYREWLDSAAITEYVGADVESGENVDILIPRVGHWPLEEAEFDVVLCTQVLEHVPELDQVLDEIKRVLRPGGQLIASVPFIYNAHAVPEDYRRLSVDGVRRIVEDDFQIVELRKEGGVGSTLGTLFLNWVDVRSSQTRTGRLLKGLLLPAWILLAAVVNTIGMLLDKLDKTGNFYGNVLMVGFRCGAHASVNRLDETA